MTTDAEFQSDSRVLILPPTRRDGEVTCAVLQRAGVLCSVCSDPITLADRIKAGIGAFVITDAHAGNPYIGLVVAALEGQPTWSDTPAILLSRTERQSTAIARLAAALTNVTILDRPTSTRTLVSAVQAAIRGRRRQYQLRDQLAALRDAEEALRIADRRKDEFLAMLAHELRNPLAPIKTASELLSRSSLQQIPEQAAVDIVKRQVTHLTRLVDDLLDVSRITQGRIQLQRQALEIASIVTDAMESVEPLIREKGHRVSVNFNARPLYVDGDSARLVQCVTNLLTNAVKYTDHAGDIRLATRAEGPHAVISVSDNGVGIPADLMPRIFGLFVQSTRSLDRSEGGLGIGLSVVLKIVEMHGGTVSAFSAGAGQGATFEIRLPQIELPMGPPAEHVPSRGPAKRVLVVDDNADAATSLAELLRLYGHEATAVYNAKAALESLRSFCPEIVLLDIGLPDMDGYQVARHMRDAGKPLRIVALTGYGQAEDIQHTRAAGFDAHLVKPVNLDVLEQVMAGSDTGGTRPH
jgi:signal transduction histidine kinase/ActR/RegA family two-component response regulator